jgi:fatty-acyl-CoA synthase
VTSDATSGRTPPTTSPLTPVAFLERAAEVYPGKPAVIHGERATPTASSRARAPPRSVLAARGRGRGDTVAVMAPNVPALLEAHYAVPGWAPC